MLDSLDTLTAPPNSLRGSFIWHFFGEHMAIPESQLDTWSHQGSVTQSSETYQTIRRALLADDSGYADKAFDVFLQGSYGNDTNIYAESDVDIVICLNSTFRYNTDSLSAPEKAAYGAYVGAATYTIDEFKTAVTAQLRRCFGDNAVTVGEKALRIKSDNNRRSSDVVVCYEYRGYKSFSPSNTSDYKPGIIFPTASGEIINYPKHHSANLTTQHQATSNMLKPMVRILKNMRSRLVRDGLIMTGVAPSYYVEGSFFNVPTEEYVSTSFGDTFSNGVNWLIKADKSKLVCANWQYYLLGNLNVQWTSEKYTQFLTALVKQWNDW
ncbi:MAG TPA: nucleotidyltransferase [Humisphaera sp.]|nr:nucleotidyltransferase [Humisphaera sp.]